MVAMAVTQPLWPFMVPRRDRDSDMVAGGFWCTLETFFSFWGGGSGVSTLQSPVHFAWWS